MSGSSSKTVQVNIVGDSSKLENAASKGASALSRFGSHVHATWSAIGSAFSNSAIGEEFSNLTSMFSGLGSVFSDLKENGMHVGTMLVGIGGAATAAGSALEMFASPLEAAHNMLSQAYTNIGSNMADFQGQIGHTIDSMTKYGYTSDQVQNSLSTLVVGTHSATKGFDLINVAANLAAKENISLQQASTQVVQLLAGKGTRALSQFGIQTTTAYTATSILTAEGIKYATHAQKQAAETKALAMNQVLYRQRLEEVSRVTKGDASAAADTFTGRIKAIRAEVLNAVMDFAQKYGPTIQMAGMATMVFGGIVDGVTSIIGLFKGEQKEGTGATELQADATEQLTAAWQAMAAAQAEVLAGQEALAEAMGVTAGATDVEAASAEAADVATTGLDLSLGLILAAVAALGIGVYELVSHWSTVWGAIKRVTLDVWHAIDNDFIHPFMSAISDIVDWVKDHWKLIVEILLTISGPVGMIIALFWQFHDQIANVFDDVWHFIDNAWNNAVNAGTTFLNWFGSLPGKIYNWASSMWDPLYNFFVPIINSIINAYNDTVGWLVGQIPDLQEVGQKAGKAYRTGFNEGNQPSPTKKPNHFGEFGSGHQGGGGSSRHPHGLSHGGGATHSTSHALARADHGGAATGGDIVIHVEGDVKLDGQTVGRVLWPTIRTHALRSTARNATRVGLT